MVRWRQPIFAVRFYYLTNRTVYVKTVDKEGSTQSIKKPIGLANGGPSGFPRGEVNIIIDEK